MDRNDIGKALRALDGREIAKKLAQAAPLPMAGVAAGQSVASVAMEALGISLARPVNDVDVFLNERLSPEILEKARNRNEALGGRLSKLSSRVSSSISRGLDSSGYSFMASATVKDGYQLLRATREGMLNEVYYRRTRLFEDMQVNEVGVVIKAFDLNCAQIGLNLKSGELEWTPDFEEFLASHELRVMNVATPFHTAARYFKKKQELGCHGDDELNMAACALPSVMGLFGEADLIDGRSRSMLAVGRFGKKTRDQAIDAKDRMDPWFSLERPETRLDIWTMRPNWTANGAVFEKLRGRVEIHGEKVPSPFIGAPELLIPKASNWVQACLRPRSGALEEQLERLSKAMTQSGCSEAQRVLYTDIAKVEGPAWASGKAASEPELRALGRLAGSHRRFTGVLWGMSLKEQASAALRLKRLEKETGQKLYGWLEGETMEKTQELLLDPQKLEAFCKDQSMAGERKLTDPLEFKGVARLARRAAKSLLRIQFEELLTPNALEQEGKDMRHCVGGYARAVESGRSRIFKVSGPEGADRSTLETREEVDKEDGLSFEQHRAFANSDPSKRAKLATLILNTGLISEAKKRSPALSLGPALACALDDGFIAPEKMRTVERLLRLAQLEAPVSHSAYSKMWEERVKKALERHFPKPTEFETKPEVESKLKSWGERLGLRRSAQEAPLVGKDAMAGRR